MMEISVGQKVKFINEDLSGEIVEIISQDRVVVACNDGFDHNVLLSEILIMGEDNNQLYTIDNETINKKIVSSTNKPSDGVLFKYLNLNKYKFEGVVEIDLHLEELVEFPGKLDDWQRLHTQMQHVKKCLNAVLEKKNIRRIVFIHGVGTGVLKTELINYLGNFDNLYTKEADFREYGSGATEVIIKNS